MGLCAAGSQGDRTRWLNRRVRDAGRSAGGGHAQQGPDRALARSAATFFSAISVSRERRIAGDLLRLKRAVDQEPRPDGRVHGSRDGTRLSSAPRAASKAVKPLATETMFSAVKKQPEMEPWPKQLAASVFGRPGDRAG
jgi:hypothetical protein